MIFGGSSWEGEVGNDCLLLVDGTDFHLVMGYSKLFYDYKFKRTGYCYEVDLCIKTGNICWWNESYEPSDWNDEMIFKDALEKILEVAEECEMDQGYCESAPGRVKCPSGLQADPNPDMKAMSARVRSRKEMVNEWFKSWGILNTPYRHNIGKHQTVFGAIACLTQLLLQANPLFKVEYND
jgi:hypothetical protein